MRGNWLNNLLYNRNSEESNWLHHYKSLLQQWNAEAKRGQSRPEEVEPQILPTVVTKVVSPDNSVSYLIGKGANITPRPQQPLTSASVSTSTEPSTTATLLFTSIQNALATTSTTSEASVASEGVEAKEDITGLITPGMAKGAAIFLTSLLGSFLPVFDSTKQPHTASEAAKSLEGPLPSVKTGYAQVAYNNSPRQRRKSGNALESEQQPQIGPFCDEAIEAMTIGLRYENSLSDEELHAIFWELVTQYGIPLSDELRGGFQLCICLQF